VLPEIHPVCIGEVVTAVHELKEKLLHASDLPPPPGGSRGLIG
jgi:hypothetical protein